MAFTVAKTTRSGGPAATRFNAYIEGGPQLAAKLTEMEKTVRLQICKDATTAALQRMGQEWAARVPVGSPPHDPHPGAYRRAMESPTLKAGGTKTGASGTVRPGVLSDLAENQQPRLYAPKLEYRDGEPSARPAFDAVKDELPDVMGKVVWDALARYTR
jgi:hypothetical protein